MTKDFFLRYVSTATFNIFSRFGYFLPFEDKWKFTWNLVAPLNLSWNWKELLSKQLVKKRQNKNKQIVLRLSVREKLCGEKQLDGNFFSRVNSLSPAVRIVWRDDSIKYEKKKKFTRWNNWMRLDKHVIRLAFVKDVESVSSINIKIKGIESISSRQPQLISIPLPWEKESVESCTCFFLFFCLMYI